MPSSAILKKIPYKNNHHLYQKDKEQNNTSDLPSLPPLKWAGGKRWFIPHIQPYWKKHSSNRFIELFCGSLAVPIGLKPKKALLNDNNKPLIHFFKTLQKGLIIHSSFKNSEIFYYKARKRFNDLLRKNSWCQETTELFYYLNRTGYNGLCRFNNKGEFNVPFGRYKTINYKKDFSHYKKIFKHWSFSCMDFEKLSLRKDDFIYADPPYDVEFTKYSKQDFSYEDQIRLARFLSQHKGPVLISNQATSRMKKLYKDFGFQLKFLEAPRRISCTGDRTPAQELIALRNM